MRKITKLTKAQVSAMDKYAAKWLAHAMSTGPTDEDKATAAALDLYVLWGLPTPAIVWLDSPGFPETPYDAAKMATRDKYHADLTKLGNEAYEATRKLPDSIYADAGRTRLHEAVNTMYPMTVNRPLTNGQTNCAEAAWFDYLLHELDMFSPIIREDLRLSQQMRENCCWYKLTETAAFLTRRPTAVHFDGGEAHCETGPALAFADGGALWSLTGVVVDEQIVLHPETQTIEQITGEPNEEVKRIRIERRGWEWYLEQSGATLIEEKHDDICGTDEALVRLDDGEVVLICPCATTGRVYCLPVPKECQTIKAAQDFLGNEDSSNIIFAT